MALNPTLVARAIWNHFYEVVVVGFYACVLHVGESQGIVVGGKLYLLFYTNFNFLIGSDFFFRTMSILVELL